MANKNTGQSVIDALLKRKQQLVDPVTAYQMQSAELDAEIQRAKEETARTKQAEREFQLKDMRTRERAILKDAADHTAALAQVLNGYNGLSREMAALGELPSPFIPRTLTTGVDVALTFWERTQPEVLGLPPLPTPAEAKEKLRWQMIAEERERIARAEQQIKNVAGDLYTPGEGTSKQSIRRDAEHTIKISRTRITELEKQGV